ncbi:MAG: response regulator transcription factor [Sphingobacteriia bacterium]|nr:response regulator transcription factor [Sphingobacteriia bacterium]
MNTVISIVVCDDHTMFRKSLSLYLGTFKKVKVLKDFANGHGLVKFLQHHQPPSLVLMDIKMPVMNGYESTAFLKQYYPKVRVIAMSSFDNELAIAQILHMGASCFVSKNDEPDEICKAILHVHQYGYYMNKWMRYQQKNQVVPAMQLLTAKEKTILPLLCSSKTYDEIASISNISIKTVDRHRDEIFKKLNVQSRLNLALFAINNGIVV